MRRTRMMLVLGRAAALGAGMSAVMLGCESPVGPGAVSDPERQILNPPTRSTFDPVATPAAVELRAAVEAGDAIWGDRVARAEVRERAVEVLERFAFDQAPVLRANALEGLHPVPRRAEAIAIAGLADPNAGVRSAAAMTIGRLGLRDSAERVRALVRDPEPRVRAAAVYGLTVNAMSVGKDDLAAMLRHRSADVRGQAVFVLGEIGDVSALPMIRESVRFDTGGSPLERQIFGLQAAEAMVKLGETDAVDTMYAALYPSQVEQLEATALAASMLGLLAQDQAASQLVRLVEHVTPGSPQGNTRRAGWYRNDPDEQSFVMPAEVRLAAAGALARLGYTDGVYVARQYMDHPERAIRAQAAFTFGLMNPRRVPGPARGMREQARREALGRLSLMMEERDPLVRVHAAAGVLRLIEGDPEMARR